MSNISLVNFTDFSLEQKKEILMWRNNPLIREWMYNPNKTSLEQHLSFIESLKTRSDKLYFLVKYDAESIGVIDFVKIIKNQSLHMGIYANPEARGCGKILMEQIINYSFDVLNVKKIYAEVFSENKRAYELYCKFGFKQFSTTIVNNKEVVCMELDYENR